ncbi:pentatricopeptide repeat-containing protein At4g14170 [Diospyros lotus]|uniref:pentatricopeptide repeat-containing protein At4g14170 n=1 Tax=Diospyros lotus TaxID=55363 RepID=UPI00225A442F|nr:pentatricopeptide repeat-containing protein At4g14170 [Diospyros lotus]XP_052200467.1 pentatricopeptide repeat-containing protein At4g14170 [Diospyros lotus]
MQIVAKALCCNTKKLFSTLTHSNLVSHYFSLLHSSPNPIYLRHLHARLLRAFYLYDNVILSSKLVLMYSHHKKLYPEAFSVFFHMPHRNIYSWNIIIGEFSRSSLPEKSIDLFLQMRNITNCEVQPDVFTLPLVLRACAGAGMVNLGILVHGFCIKTGMDMSLFVASALVFMYVTFGKILDARVVFDEMPQRDAVLWTAMLAGYAQREEPMLALSVFREMMIAQGVEELDGAVMVSLLLVCAQLGWLKQGKSVHGWCIRRCLGLGLCLGNALIDMYVKCAALCHGHKVFDKMPEKDVISWSSLILGYGLGGYVDVAIELFDKMQKQHVKPNGITFLGVLSACTHGGLVKNAQSIFRMMKDYGVVAELKHYACMVDCLSRAGLLTEAERLIEEMPSQPDAAVLGALLGGCRVHGNLEMGVRIAKRLVGLEPETIGYYVLLANIYADAGRYHDAERIWEITKHKNIFKLPGCSMIESRT